MVTQEEAVRQYLEAKPELDAMRREREADAVKEAEAWQESLRILSQKPDDSYFNVEIRGTMVPVKVRFGFKAQVKLERLIKSLDTLGKESGREDEMASIAGELIEVITSGHITAKWLSDNPEALSAEEIGLIIRTFMDKREEYTKRIRSFRP